MRKIKNKLLFPLIFLAVTILLCAIFTINTDEADAESYNTGAYGFHFENYEVTCDISGNREIAIREDLTVTFDGDSSTGFTKDIPVNGKEKVRNIKVYEIKEGEEKSVWYDVYPESDDLDNPFLLIDIGDYATVKTNETHTYRIDYKYILPYSAEEKNLISLNVIGRGRQKGAYIKNAAIKLILPDGFKSGVYYTKDSPDRGKTNFSTSSDNGRKVIKLSGLALSYDDGVTFDLNFEDGALSSYFDFTPYIAVIIGAAVLVLMFLTKALFYNKSVLTPVVCFDAPDGMDPLLMGKLIDNNVDPSDITSMLYYWADKGYIKINLENEADPVLIRIYQNLPEGSPDYEVMMFQDIFASSDVAPVSSLKNRFYKTADKAKGMVNAKAKNLYSKKSCFISFLFTLICAIIAGLTPTLYAIFNISIYYRVFEPLVCIVILAILYLLSMTVKFNSNKLKKGKTVIIYCGIIIFGLIFGLVYAIACPSHVIEFLPKFILYAVCMIVSISSVALISRTDEYTKQLNGILGFRNFIMLAEKDRLEKLLEDNPQFYYHVLPYAQVLGVSDIWEEKFANLTVAPPDWFTSSVTGNIIEFHIINSIIRGSMTSITKDIVSRPSSSGSSGFGGGFGGGSFGGGFGGGHGGGGFRGR